jgi:hypothetical protein
MSESEGARAKMREQKEREQRCESRRSKSKDARAKEQKQRCESRRKNEKNDSESKDGMSRAKKRAAVR